MHTGQGQVEEVLEEEQLHLTDRHPVMVEQVVLNPVELTVEASVSLGEEVEEEEEADLKMRLKRTTSYHLRWKRVIFRHGKVKGASLELQTGVSGLR